MGTQNTIASKLQEEHAAAGSWRKLASVYQVSAGTLSRIVSEPGWLPKDKTIRKRLGIIKPRAKKLTDMSAEELRAAFVNREPLC